MMMTMTEREAFAMPMPALTLPAGTRARCTRTGDLGTTASEYDPSDPWLSPSCDPRRASVSFVADSPLRGHSKQRDELVSDLEPVPSYEQARAQSAAVEARIAARVSAAFPDGPLIWS